MFPINDNPNSSVSGGGNFCQAASSSRTREEEARRQAAAGLMMKSKGNSSITFCPCKLHVTSQRCLLSWPQKPHSIICSHRGQHPAAAIVIQPRGEDKNVRSARQTSSNLSIFLRGRHF